MNIKPLDWTLILFFDQPLSLVDEDFYSYFISNIQHQLSLIDVIVYSDTFTITNAKCFPFNLSLFSVLYKYIDRNIIFIKSQGFIGSLDLLKYNTGIYAPIINFNKLDINKLILSNMLIIPYNPIFINTAIEFFNKGSSIDLSLTLSSLKLSIPIKNINQLNVISSFDKKELFISKYFNQFTGLFDNYIFYPSFDIDGDKKLLDLSNLSNVFNTNGFSIDTHDIYSLMFPRFLSKSSGLYIKQPNNSNIIPKILHHVWLTEPNMEIIELWKKILYDWEYIIWTPDKFNLGKWKDVYEKNKLLSIYLSILEKYGGIIINGEQMPLKKIPDDFLKEKFWLTFDENNKLSYNILGSIQGIQEHEKIDSINDPSRLPYEGKNNYFINLKLNRNIDDDKLLFYHIYQQIFNSLLNDNFDINDLLKNHNVVVYPNYYFNPNDTYPRFLLKKAISYPIIKKEIKLPTIKTNLKRDFIMTEKSIKEHLKQNPKDRLKNLNQI